MQKEIPILFSTTMVQALLGGRKTMTRRTVKMTKDDIKEAKWGYTCFTPDRHISFRGKHASGEYGESFIKCPYGKKGDILWVRETSKPKYVKGGLEGFRLQYPKVYPWLYAADGECEEGYGAWKPSIHMPKAAARIWLEVESIRVERLQDITEEDAKNEGVEVAECCHAYYHGFSLLWQKINGAESWKANPWVWVVSFKVLSTTRKPDSLLTTHNSQ